MNPILRANRLSRSFGSHKTPILSNISFELQAGESLAITGRSGEGKSTLLHILGTLDRPSGGSLEISGRDPFTLKHLDLFRNRSIGFIFQFYHLLEERSLMENILLPAWIGRQRVDAESSVYKKMLKLLEVVGLSSQKNQLVKELSGGEKQRVAILRAIVNNPDLILADEPTGNLDSYHAASIQKLLLELVKVEGKSLIIVTHDQQLASSCDRTLLIKNGELHEPIQMKCAIDT